jgi:hypothetical protein
MLKRMNNVGVQFWRIWWMVYGMQLCLSTTLLMIHIPLTFVQVMMARSALLIVSMNHMLTNRT